MSAAEKFNENALPEPTTHEARTRYARAVIQRRRLTDSSWSELSEDLQQRIRIQATVWGMSPRDLFAQLLTAGIEVMRDEYPGFTL